MRRIFVFTASYPYDKARESTFIEPELEELVKHHDMTVIPLRKGGKLHGVREGVKVATGFCEMASHKPMSVLRIITKCNFWRLFFKEVAENPRIIWSRACMKKLFIHLYYCLNLKSWLSRHVDGFLKNRSGQDIPVFYSYWFDSAVTALCLLKKEGLKAKIITRAHGFDLYEFRHAKNYIPFRKMALEDIDKVVFISENGLNYMKESFPDYAEKYVFFPMGIKDPGRCSEPSVDSKFRILSCSMMVPVKRVTLIAETVCRLGRMAPESRWEWVHIGDGPERKNVEKICSEKKCGTLDLILKGNMENDEVLEYYKREPVDLYVILSSSEGRPVALMEAMGNGIPVLATDVGGVGEMVMDGANGILLPADLTAEMAAEAIISLRNSPEKLSGMREESRKVFHERTDSAVNFSRFSAFLENL